MYCSRYIIRVMNEDEMGGACSTYRYKRNVHRVLGGKPEVKRLLARPGRRWAYNIRMVIKNRIGFIWLRTGTRFRLLCAWL